MLFDDKIAIVTGATRGIGKAIAAQLAAEGATVVGTATSQSGAEKISAALASTGGCGMVLNVADQGSIDECMSAVSERYGAPTILINNAGITRDNLLLRMSDDEWNDIINTNLSAIYRMSKACLKGMMKARFGRIINIGSVVGLTGNPGQANYAAAKAGILGFTKSLAQEIGSRGITVNTVAPGFIATDMTSELPEEQQKLLLSKIPMKRLGEPEDIAQAVQFLASSAAAYITGETINVNGGMYMP